MNLNNQKECLDYLEHICQKCIENIRTLEIIAINYDDAFSNPEKTPVDTSSVDWKKFVKDIDAYFEVYPSPDYEIKIKARLNRCNITESELSDIAVLIHEIKTKISVDKAKKIQQKRLINSTHQNVSNNRDMSTMNAVERVFIIHGHDDELKNTVARFLEHIGLEAIILHEQPSEGMTIIEKIEHYTDVGFAIALYTPCDYGKSIDEENLKNRARQNVILEHGFLMGKLGRNRVCALVKGEVEKPSDIAGIVYITYDPEGGWQQKVVTEMRAVGYNVSL